MEMTEHRVDPKLLSRMFEANQQFADWLIDEHGILEDYYVTKGHMGPGPEVTKFEARRPWKDASKRIDRMIGPGEIGSYLAEHLESEFLKKGGKLLLKTSAYQLLTDESGKITGVLAKDEGGEVEITCQAVVVAAGAFSRNKELMNKFQPLFYQNEGKEPIHIFTGAGSTGDGITMCDALGADIDYVNRRVNMFGPMRHPYPCASMAVYQNHDGFEIGSQGNPFFSPMGIEVSGLTKDPKWHGWKIVDDAICVTAIQEAMEEPPQSLEMDLPKFQAKWREVFAEEELGGAIVSANSLEELADKLGIDRAVLLKDVADYNESTTKPQDFPPDMPEFMRPKHAPMPVQTAPFYAIKMKMFHENSIGGMTIDENASVLKNGTPIPGLYAAGDTTRGIMVSGDVGVDYLEGVFSSLTMAYNEGYIAGTEAAKYCD
jgi:fumarate reductase flavoprotein subunit